MGIAMIIDCSVIIVSHAVLRDLGSCRKVFTDLQWIAAIRMSWLTFFP